MASFIPSNISFGALTAAVMTKSPTNNDREYQQQQQQGDQKSGVVATAANTLVDASINVLCSCDAFYARAMVEEEDAVRRGGGGYTAKGYGLARATTRAAGRLLRNASTSFSCGENIDGGDGLLEGSGRFGAMSVRSAAASFIASAPHILDDERDAPLAYDRQTARDYVELYTAFSVHTDAEEDGLACSVFTAPATPTADDDANEAAERDDVPPPRLRSRRQHSIARQVQAATAKAISNSSYLMAAVDAAASSAPLSLAYAAVSARTTPVGSPLSYATAADWLDLHRQFSMVESSSPSSSVASSSSTVSPAEVDDAFAAPAPAANVTLRQRMASVWSAAAARYTAQQQSGNAASASTSAAGHGIVADATRAAHLMAAVPFKAVAAIGEAKAAVVDAAASALAAPKAIVAKIVPSIPSLSTDSLIDVVDKLSAIHVPFVSSSAAALDSDSAEAAKARRGLLAAREYDDWSELDAVFTN